MNRQEFVDHIEKLKETYGDKAYPDPRVERIWQWARKIKEPLFKIVVSDAIADCERAPLLGKLKEIYGNTRQSNPDAHKYHCDYCGGSGWVPDSQPLPTAYACRCDAGNVIADVIPRWKGPWVRRNPLPQELMRANVKNIINNAIKGVGDAT